MFKIIQDEAGKTQLKIVSIFNDRKYNPNLSSYTEKRMEDWKQSAAALDVYKHGMLREGIDDGAKDGLYEQYIKGDEALEKFTKGKEVADLKSNDFIKTMQKEEIVLDAQAGGVKNANKVFNAYYKSVGDGTGANKELQNAIAKANPLMGKAVRECNDASAALKQFKKQSKMANIGGFFKNLGASILNIGTSMIIGSVISLIVSIPQRVMEAQEEARRKAAEAAQEAEEESKKLTEESAEVEKLRKSLDSGNLSQSEAVSTREKLIKKQNELIKKYGKEAKGIDLVNGKLSDQKKIYEELEKAQLEKKYRENVGKWDESIGYITTLPDSFLGINSGNETTLDGDWMKWFAWMPDIHKNSQKLNEGKINALMDKNVQSALRDIFETDKGTKIDINLSEDGFSFNIGDAIKEDGGGRKEILKTYDLLLEKLEALRTAYSQDPEYSGDSNLLNGISAIMQKINDAKGYWIDDTYNDNLKMFNQNMELKIEQDAKAKKSYQALTAARDEYEKGVANNKDIKAQSEDLAIYQSAVNQLKQQIEEKAFGTGEEAEGKYSYLNDKIDEAQEYINTKQLELKLKLNTDGVQDDAQNAIDMLKDSQGRNMSSAEIDTMVNLDLTGSLSKSDNYTQTQKQGFQQLKEAAKNAGVELKTYISILSNLGIIQGAASTSTTSFTVKIKSSSDEINQAIDSIQDAYKKVHSALTEYNQTGVLSLDAAQELVKLSPKYVNALVSENGQLQLNRDAYIRLTEAKLQEQEITLQQEAINSLDKLQTEAEAKEFITKNTIKKTKATKDETKAQWELAYANAAVKDAENNTDYFTKATSAAYRLAKKKVAILEVTRASLKRNADATLGATNAEKDSTRAIEANKNALERKKKALESQKKKLEENKKALEDKQKALEEENEELQKAQGYLNNLITTTMDWIKQTKNDEIKALEKKKKAFDEQIDKEIELLDAEKKRADYEDELRKKTNSLAKASLARTAASLDTSSMGQANYKKAQDEYDNAYSEFNSYLVDQGYELRKEALNRRKEAEDKFYDEQIETIQNYLNNEKKIYNDACNWIDNKTGELKSKLLKYWKEHTTKTTAEFNIMWTKASEALIKYGKLYTGEDGKTPGINSILGTFATKIQNNTDKIEVYKEKIDKLSTKMNTLSERINKVSDSINSTSNALNDIKNKYSQAAIAYSAYNDQDERFIRNQEKKNKKKTKKEKKKQKSYRVTYKGHTIDVLATSKKEAVKEAKSSMINWLGSNGYIDEMSKVIHMGVDDLLKTFKVTQSTSGHRKGTPSSPGGVKRVDEEGAYTELIPYQTGKGRYVILPKGNPVFSKEMTDNLFDFAGNPLSYIKDLSSKLTKSTLAKGSLIANSSTNYAVNPIFNLSVSGDAKNASALLKREGKKLMDEAVNKVYKTTLANAGRNKNRF